MNKSLLSALICNILLAYVIFFLCRLIFLAENWMLFSGDMTASAFWGITKGGLLFDTSAICYLNALYILLMLIPVPWKECRAYYRVVKWVYVVPNALAVVANLADSVFYPFNKQRASSMVFAEFANEDNIANIVATEFVNHWYLVLAGTLLIFLLIILYRSPKPVKPVSAKSYYSFSILALVVVGVAVVAGMRGGSLSTAVRPISINESQRFVERPQQAALVLNTPFSILRTISQAKVKVPDWFSDEEMTAIFSPVHLPVSNDSVGFRDKNVVILIVESFAEEFVGARNRDLDGGLYKGYTPFADSLLSQSLTFKHTIANAGFSIDAMPAVLASIPRFGRPYVLSPYSTNSISSIATELSKKGYVTSFFHGAPNNSMGFKAFARNAGFKNYFGIEEYCNDSRFGGMDDFDGTWGIWDEKFLQYFCLSLSEMEQPFLASVFTLSSHHPFAIPDEYKDIFVDEGKFPLHKCVRYADYALRRFFETASTQPWYDNTIFVITADHASSRITHDVYKSDVGLFRIPILIFDPSGEMPRGTFPGIMQQIDIMPTLLSYLHYDLPYIAFGKNMLDPDASQWAFNWDHVCQYMLDDYVLQIDADGSPKAFFNYVSDPLMKNNIIGDSPMQKDMERRIKALVQTFFVRGAANDMTYTK